MTVIYVKLKRAGCGEYSKMCVKSVLYSPTACPIYTTVLPTQRAWLQVWAFQPQAPSAIPGYPTMPQS